MIPEKTKSQRAPPELTELRYLSESLEVRVRKLPRGQGLRIHMEHTSGAALIIPSCQAEVTNDGMRATTTGFDGTHYELLIADKALEVRASQPSTLLGGKTTATILRTDDILLSTGAIRITGDEVTVPINTDKK